MSTYHVVPVPGAGHVHPMLPVAAELVRRGEEVTVWLPPSFGAAARATGARYRELPDVEPPIPNGRPNLRTIGAMIRALRRPPTGLVETLRPGDVVVYDAMTSWARRLPPAAGVTAVPFACTAVTGGAGMAAGLAGPVARLLRRDRVGVERKLLASPLPRLLDRIPRPMRLAAGPALVAVPRAFQPRADGFGPDVVFVGPCLEPRADEAEHPLLAELAGETRPIVLVALGSAFNHRPEFYRQVFLAVSGRPWRVVVAIGGRTDPAELGSTPDNVTVLPWVPQLRVLEKAAAFVSHAGMGSVQESLSAGVPLVLFPQMVEQRANARRVAGLGAGMLLGRKPDAAEIRAAVQHVLTDPTVASAVARLRQEAGGAGGQRRAADVLQGLAGSPAQATR